MTRHSLAFAGLKKNIQRVLFKSSSIHGQYEMMNVASEMHWYILEASQLAVPNVQTLLKQETLEHY